MELNYFTHIHTDLSEDADILPSLGEKYHVRFKIDPRT
jgi:hypothetical protein